MAGRQPRDSGELDTRGELQEPNPTQDTSGQEVPSWRTVKTVWMKVEGVTGAEGLRGQQVEGIGTYIIWMRYRPEVSVTWRIKLGSRTLQIASAIDPDNRKTWLLCSAKEVAS